MKTTIYDRGTHYSTFFGEFSRQWVGIATIYGEVMYSVQRPTRALADYAVRNNLPRFA